MRLLLRFRELRDLLGSEDPRGAFVGDEEGAALCAVPFPDLPGDAIDGLLLHALLDELDHLLRREDEAQEIDREIVVPVGRFEDDGATLPGVAYVQDDLALRVDTERVSLGHRVSVDGQPFPHRRFSLVAELEAGLSELLDALASGTNGTSGTNVVHFSSLMLPDRRGLRWCLVAALLVQNFSALCRGPLRVDHSVDTSVIVTRQVPAPLTKVYAGNWRRRKQGVALKIKSAASPSVHVHFFIAKKGNDF